jgi:SAM-dependent methyltransferase
MSNAIATPLHRTTPQASHDEKRNAREARPIGAPGVEMESVSCYLCGSDSRSHFLYAEDDLSGLPGTFQFVTCNDCGLKYQHPRIPVENIKAYYDDEYLSHRKRANWGPLTKLYQWGMDKHDRDKDALVSRYVSLGPDSQVLDVGCAVGTFLAKIRAVHGSKVTGVDFKDVSTSPWMKDVEFHCGLFDDQPVGEDRFDLLTMWHFLEHEYDPMRALAKAKKALKSDGRLVMEVPRLDSVSFDLFGERWPGLQAPQHTILFDKDSLLRTVEKAGFEVVEHLSYGAFPPYFYLFAGAAFKLLNGGGINQHLSKLIYPYFLGHAALAPILAFEKKLNLAMQTVVCRKR